MQLLIAAVSYGENIAVYVQSPIADVECAEAVKNILSIKHNAFYLTHDTLNSNNLRNVDCLVFPGGLGDVDAFDKLLKDRKRVVQSYFNSKHVYMGICMGAYIAGKDYFNIARDVKITQYIKRPTSKTRTQLPTVTKCTWNNHTHMMYFFDGPVFVGRLQPAEKIACYSNGDAAAIIKKTSTGTFVGIGPHPESTEEWYDTDTLKPYWHKHMQHHLILDALDQAFKTNK